MVTKIRGDLNMDKVKRVAALTFIACIGFLLGIAANVIFTEAFPLLIDTFPLLSQMTWIRWGLVGTLLSVAVCIIYAYLT
jgi:ABC-type antimicrobial peptide transport system permease subunit